MAAFDDLIGNAFGGTIALIYNPPDDYFGYAFTPNRGEIRWSTKPGTYNALRGLWIFKPNVNIAWQVQGGGWLGYWNADGRATGNPEDMELFVFESVDAAQKRVHIKNVYGGYVHLVENHFRADASVAGADTFTVKFV